MTIFSQPLQPDLGSHRPIFLCVDLTVLRNAHCPLKIRRLCASFCVWVFAKPFKNSKICASSALRGRAQPVFRPRMKLNFLDNKSQRTMTVGFVGGCTSRDRSATPPLLQFSALPPLAITHAPSMGCGNFRETFRASSIGSTHASFRSHPWGDGEIFLSRF